MFVLLLAEVDTSASPHGTRGVVGHTDTALSRSAMNLRESGVACLGRLCLCTVPMSEAESLSPPVSSKDKDSG